MEVNTGAPQGCVLSPTLFTVYTNDCTAGSENCTIIKYADDTVLLGLILNDDEEAYRDEIVIMTEWCRKHNLLLNVKKTKEIVFDFRKRQNVINQICIGNDGVEIVNKYKYLGTVICGDLKWTDNIKEQVKKANKRLYFLRKLKEFSVDTKILNLFYTSVIQSVAVFGLIIWYNSASVMDKQQVDKIRKVAQKIIGSPVTTLNDICYGR